MALRTVVWIACLALLLAAVPVRAEDDGEADWIGASATPQKPASSTSERPTAATPSEESEEPFDSIEAEYARLEAEQQRQREAEELAVRAASDSAANPTAETPAETPAAKKPEAPPQPPQPFSIYKYNMELLFVAGLLVYGYYYLRGQRQNAAYAVAWAQASLPIMEEQFSTVNTPNSKLIIKESDCDYVLYGSGRRHVKSLLAWLRLSRRFDLVTRLRPPTVAGPRDAINIFVDFMPHKMPKFICAVVQRSAQKKFLDDNEHVASFVKTYSGDHFGLPPALAVLTDSMDLAKQLLAGEVTHVLEKYQHCVQSLLISDQYPPVEELPESTTARQLVRRRVLLVNFGLPEEHLLSCKLQTLVLKMSLLMVESIAHSHLPAEREANADRARQEYADKMLKTHEKQMARAQELRVVRLQEERAAATKQGPAALQRWEEKQHQKQLKDRQRGRVMRM